MVSGPSKGASRGSIVPADHYECHAAANSAFKKLCLGGGWSDYALKHSAALLGMCAHTSDTSAVVAAIREVCRHEGQQQDM